MKKCKNTYVIGEIGINHNGSLDLAMELIDIAKNAGCDAVKFQKRTVNEVYSKEELEQKRENPFGQTNGDLKYGLEFGEIEYKKIFEYCEKSEIDCFASPWDLKSVEFLEQFNPPFYKIASASLTDIKLLEAVKKTEKPIILSVGMSTEQEIIDAIKVIGEKNLTILICTSTYPNEFEEIRLNRIDKLKEITQANIGYSGHEIGYIPTLAAVAKGCKVVERHITKSKELWGSDQKASLEPNELKEMIKSIKIVEKTLGEPDLVVLDSEIPSLKKLRKTQNT